MFSPDLIKRSVRQQKSEKIHKLCFYNFQLYWCDFKLPIILSQHYYQHRNIPRYSPRLDTTKLRGGDDKNQWLYVPTF